MIWLVLSIIILLAIGVMVYYYKTGKNHQPNYYTYFTMGIVWLAFGIAFEGMRFFFIMGLVFIAIGLLNKDKWKKHPKVDKKLTIIGIILAAIAFIIGVAVYFLI
jgi:hypothetical protein